MESRCIIIDRKVELKRLERVEIQRVKHVIDKTKLEIYKMIYP
jgi:hypothetical protein